MAEEIEIRIILKKGYNFKIKNMFNGCTTELNNPIKNQFDFERKIKNILMDEIKQGLSQLDFSNNDWEEIIKNCDWEMRQ